MIIENLFVWNIAILIMTHPLAPSSKRQKKDKDEIQLSSVLEWFDTTMKPTTMLCRDKEKEVQSDYSRNIE